MNGAACWTTAADAFEAWRSRVLNPEREPRYAVGDGFGEAVDLAPERVVCLAARPGAGKTALAMQWTLAALEAHPELHAVVANVEMTPNQLLDRLLAHASKARLTDIRNKCAPDLSLGFERIAAVARRLTFLEHPFTLAGVTAAAESDAPYVLCLDYIQRFELGGDEHEGTRISRLMSGCRDLAQQGAAVLVVSAVSRQRDSSGNAGYHGLGLASGRGSSELEFGADSLFVLDNSADGAFLHCVKDRNNEPMSIRLDADLARMTFAPGERIAPGGIAPKDKRGGAGGFRDADARAAINVLWDKVGADGGTSE